MRAGDIMKILTAFIVLLSFPLYARNHVAFIGGGGEPQGARTIFDADVGRFGDFIRRTPGTSLSVSFNGGHSRTEEKLSKSFPQNPNTPFTPQAFEALISRYESDIQSGRITSSDQLMVFIDSHGGEGQPGQSTHNIATTGGAIANYDTITGPRSVSLDRLQSLATLAESKGVKLAIVDVSCHSGATLPLANSKTCVISATGPRHYGFAGFRTFAHNFMSGMRPGRNLEEIFHDTRDNSADTDFPMISSGAGREIQDEIYPLLTRFLYDYEKSSPSKLAGNIVSSITSRSCEQEDEQLASLITLLSDVEASTNENFRRLRETVVEYQALRTNMQRRLSGMLNHPAMTESRQVCHNVTCFRYTGREVLSMNIDTVVRVAREGGMRSPSQAAFYRSWENTVEQLRPWKAQLLANPALASYPQFFESYPGLERQSERLAKRVSREERRLYREMYEARAGNHQGPNPCRDFRI